VVTLLSLKHSAAILWSDQDSDVESMDMETGNSNRLFTFEVTKTNKQEENVVACPSFQVLPYSSSQVSSF